MPSYRHRNHPENLFVMESEILLSSVLIIFNLPSPYNSYIAIGNRTQNEREVFSIFIKNIFKIPVSVMMAGHVTFVPDLKISDGFSFVFGVSVSNNSFH